MTGFQPFPVAVTRALQQKPLEPKWKPNVLIFSEDIWVTVFKRKQALPYIKKKKISNKTKGVIR